MTKLNSAV